jgi:hypothetical protein
MTAFLEQHGRPLLLESADASSDATERDTAGRDDVG